MTFKSLLGEIASNWVRATNEQFSGHRIANLLREELVNELIIWLGDRANKYTIKSSAGAGNWANVPWLSILDPSITKTTQSGIYPVYLFNADGSGVYLSLGFGSTELVEKYGKTNAKIKASELKDRLRKQNPLLNNWSDSINLHATTALGQSYEWASAGAKYYSTGAIPDDELLFKDLNELLEIYSKLNQVDNYMVFPTTTKRRLAKSFVLLAGISGTGKTRFIREQAEQSGSLAETYQLVPVRPDWHEPSDLLGYVSRLNGKPEYVATDVLKFMVKAWQAILKAGFDFNGEKITGNKNSLESVAPYWLCLDEMNLAPVEQYFADYLSVIETRKWKHDGDDVEYTCDALLSKDTIKDVADSLRAVLDLNGTENDALWSHFTAFGISLPFNLIVAGTVNMDETTHGFSRKVLDRALSFDFGEFFPNNFDTFFAPDTQNFTLSYPIWSDGRNLDALSSTIDVDGSKSVAFLKAVNTALDKTPFKLAFRALNELLLAVICTQPQTEQALMAVWDDFVMCKVLPRIEGDYDKLAVNPNANGEQSTVLSELKKVLAEQMPLIWDGEQRPDLYREKTMHDASGSKTILIACRSNKKLVWMEQRLSGASFTSFWP